MFDFLLLCNFLDILTKTEVKNKYKKLTFQNVKNHLKKGTRREKHKIITENILESNLKKEIEKSVMGHHTVRDNQLHKLSRAARCYMRGEGKNRLEKKFQI